MPTATPPNPKVYSFAQLEALWIQNGGDRASAPLMAAIALAESRGNPLATNKTDNKGRQTSWGLWQISDGTHNMPRANILDPNVNAQAAVAKKKSQGLTAWGTYTSGAYRKYMSGAAPDSNGIPGSTTTAQPASFTGDIGSAIGDGLGTAFKAVLQPIISTMIWGSEILFGIAAIMVGTTLFALNTDKGKQTAEAITKAAVTAAAPEALPVMVSSSKPTNATRAMASQKVAEQKPQREQARVVHSREEFTRLRKSGYNGPIRHEYGNRSSGNS